MFGAEQPTFAQLQILSCQKILLKNSIIEKARCQCGGVCVCLIVCELTLNFQCIFLDFPVFNFFTDMKVVNNNNDNEP